MLQSVMPSQRRGGRLPDYVPVRAELLLLVHTFQGRISLLEAESGLRGRRLGGGRVLLRLCKFDGIRGDSMGCSRSGSFH